MITPTDLKFLCWYIDPGHGWLGVPIRILLESGAASQISTCSYIQILNGQMAVAYLEEDCDAPKFLAAIGMAVIDWDGIPTEHLTDSPGRPCFVRQLHPYVVAEVVGPTS